jgi:hypothetical protein
MKLSQKPIFTDDTLPGGSYVPVSVLTDDGPRIMRVDPDKIGAQGPAGPTGPEWSPTHSALAYSATVTPDFLGDNYKTVALSGNIDFTASSNRIDGGSVVIFVQCDGTPRNLVFNVGWKFFGAKPATIAAGKEGRLTITCKGGTAETDIRAEWVVEL